VKKSAEIRVESRIDHMQEAHFRRTLKELDPREPRRRANE